MYIELTTALLMGFGAAGYFIQRLENKLEEQEKRLSELEYKLGIKQNVYQRKVKKVSKKEAKYNEWHDSFDWEALKERQDSNKKYS